MSDNLTPTTTTDTTPDTTSPGALCKAVFFGYARHGITALAAWLMHKGILDQDGGTCLVSLLLGIASLAWSTGYKLATKTAHEIAMQAVAKATAQGIPGPASVAAKAVVALLLPALMLQGCATDPTTGKLVFDKQKAEAVAAAVGNNLINDAGKIAMGELAVLVSSAAQGDTSKAALQQAAATGLWTSIGSINVAGDVQNIVTAWNGNSAPQIAAAAASVYATANPQTPAAKAAVVHAIATTIDAAASPSAPPSAVRAAVRRALCSARH